MKTLLTFATVAFVASVAQAASINWSVGGKSTTVVNDYAGKPFASTTAYLVLASDSDLESITDLSSKGAFETALGGITLNNEFTSTADGKKPTVADVVVSSNALSAGVNTAFGLLVFSQDAEGNGYYKVAKANGSPYAAGTPVADQTTLTTSWASLNSSSWAKAWSVPEPATGALALAGIALLFRRRKA